MKKQHRESIMIHQLLTFFYTCYTHTDTHTDTHTHTHIFFQSFWSRLQISLHFTPAYFSMHPKKWNIISYETTSLPQLRKSTTVLSNIHAQIFSTTLKISLQDPVVYSIWSLYVFSSRNLDKLYFPSLVLSNVDYSKGPGQWTCRTSHFLDVSVRYICFLIVRFKSNISDKSLYRRLDLLPNVLYHELVEKEMATHSSTLAWKIPWTEGPGRLQSMGSQRVRYDWETSLSFFL